MEGGRQAPRAISSLCDALLVDVGLGLGAGVWVLRQVLHRGRGHLPSRRREALHTTAELADGCTAGILGCFELLCPL